MQLRNHPGSYLTQCDINPVVILAVFQIYMGLYSVTQRESNPLKYLEFRILDFRTVSETWNVCTLEIVNFCGFLIGFQQNIFFAGTFDLFYVTVV